MANESVKWMIALVGAIPPEWRMRQWPYEYRFSYAPTYYLDKEINSEIRQIKYAGIA